MTAVPERQQRNAGDIQLKVSPYDQVSSLLISLLILVGAAVGLMFVLWLTAQLVLRPRGFPFKLVENVGGRGPHAEGFERDLEPPGFEELPELREPQLEADLEAVTNDPSALTAALEVLDTLSTISTRGEEQRGDSRPPGPLGEGDDIIPRWERWEIRWASTSVEAYARQLDFFEIELAALGGGLAIDYATNLTKARPDRRSGTPKQETRLYMTWSNGTLVDFDRTLLGRAGIVIARRELMQFYPEQIENRLAMLELQNADGRTAKDFLRTVFEVRPRGRGYEFVVTDQTFR